MRPGNQTPNNGHVSPGGRTLALTAKQSRFVEEYLIDLCATRAAVRAGYSRKTAYRIGWENLKKPQIAAAIEKAQAQLSARTGETVERVLKGLRENLDRAMQHQPVLDREGKPIGEYVYQGNVANRALELIGKHLGMFVERHRHEGDINLSGVIVVPSSEMNSEEWQKQARQQQADAAARAADDLGT